MKAIVIHDKKDLRIEERETLPPSPTGAGPFGVLSINCARRAGALEIVATDLADNLKGSFRFHEEFAMAVNLMSEGLVDVGQLITHTFALDDAEQVFITANDRSVAMKTQIAFTP